MQQRDVLVLIEEMKETLTPVGRKLADYIVNDPAKAASMSIRELSNGSGTSDAAVMRFCKNLGYSSYRELVIALTLAAEKREERVASPLCKYVDVNAGDSVASVIRNISYSNQKSINDTMMTLDEKEVEKAVVLMEKAERILFCGIGASGLVCLDAQQKFLRINRYCQAFTDSHMQLTAAALLGQDDVAVLVSSSGETKEIIDHLAVLKENNVPVIAITRYSRSPLASRSDVVLSISTPEHVIRSGAMGSRIAMLNVIDILYACLLSRSFDSYVVSLEQTRNVLDSRKLRKL